MKQIIIVGIMAVIFISALFYAVTNAQDFAGPSMITLASVS
jgi:hypothetical protein